MFPACLVVPSLPHPAADRQQEALHQPRGVCVRRTLHLRRHRPDLPFPAADYWCFYQISAPKGKQMTGCRQSVSQNQNTFIKIMTYNTNVKG